jgi:hypothetical protein
MLGLVMKVWWLAGTSGSPRLVFHITNASFSQDSNTVAWELHTNVLGFINREWVFSSCVINQSKHPPSAVQG